MESSADLIYSWCNAIWFALNSRGKSYKIWIFSVLTVYWRYCWLTTVSLVYPWFPGISECNWQLERISIHNWITSSSQISLFYLSIAPSPIWIVSSIKNCVNPLISLVVLQCVLYQNPVIGTQFRILYLKIGLKAISAKLWINWCPPISGSWFPSHWYWIVVASVILDSWSVETLSQWTWTPSLRYCSESHCRGIGPVSSSHPPSLRWYRSTVHSICPPSATGGVPPIVGLNWPCNWLPTWRF